MKLAFFEDRALATSLLIAMGVAATEVAPWAFLFALVFVAWKFFHEKFSFPKISTKITPIFGLIVFAIVYLEHKTFLGQEESATVLLGLTAISILNYESERDKLFLVLLGFLIVVLKSVFSFDFIWILPAIICFFGLWLSLITNKRIERFKFLVSTVLKSIPLLVILFVVFPRVVIFQSQRVANQTAQSGFSEDLNPGRFSRAAASDQMVFRVEFLNSNFVDKKHMYWRGAVLKVSNGMAWSKGANERNRIEIRPTNDLERIAYQAVLEPLNVRNVFVLEKPLSVKANGTPIYSLKDSLYTFSERQQQAVQFIGEASLSGVIDGEEDDIADPKYTRTAELPEKTLNWVNITKSKYNTVNERLEALTNFFKKGGFVYSLSPGAYTNNLDQFLFVKREGFCEHYAGSFATLARALEIPARVIVGYQGGVYNEMGNFWKITQKDAHAWVEIGIKDHWIRIDPTSFVSPLRISLGAEEYFSLSPEEQKQSSLDKKNNMNVVQLAWNNITLIFDNLNYKWTVFLLNYDLQMQIDILKSIDFSWAYVLVAVVFLLVLFFVLNRAKNKKQKKEHIFYNLFLRIEKWARSRKIHLTPQMTANKILSEIQMKYPQYAVEIAEFALDYERAVYQQKPPLQDEKWWLKKWKLIFKN